MDNDKRQFIGRIFGFAGMIGLVFFFSTYYRRTYPIITKVRFLYKGVQNPQKLEKVSIEIFQKEDSFSEVSFYHTKMLPSDLSQFWREQKVALPVGHYRLKIRLFYRNNTVLRLNTSLPIIKDAGVYFVHLAKAQKQQ